MKQWRWVLGCIVALALAGGVAHAQIVDDDDDATPRPTDTEEAPAKATPGERAQNRLRLEQQRRALESQGLTLPGAVDPETYHVGPGDLIQISIWGGISRTWTIEVGPEGTLLLTTS